MAEENKLSPIEEKLNKDKSNQEKKSNNHSNWKSFGLSILTNIVLTLLWTFVGANAIYLVYSNLDAWFPTDPNNYPYGENYQSMKGGKGKNVQKGGGDLSNPCKTVYDNISSSDASQKLLQKMSGNKVSFPYSEITNNFGIRELVGNFFGYSARTGFISSRQILKQIFKFIRKWCDSGSGFMESALFLLAYPIFVISLIFGIPFLIGTFATIWGEITSSSFGLLWTILFALLFGIGLSWTTIIGVIIFVKYMLTMLVLPSIADIDNIKRLIFCKRHIIIGIFSILTSVSAFKHLDDITAIITTVVLLSMTFFGGIKANATNTVSTN
jgi:hypothetical protein